jgi:hypothetical protein
MGLFDLLFKKDDGKPVIRSKEEFIDYLVSKGASSEAAKVFGQAREMSGREGFIDIKRGGKGSPYEVLGEFIDHHYTRQQQKDAIARCKGLSQQYKLTTTEADREVIRRQIAELTGNKAVIWINVPTDEEFLAKKEQLKKAQELASTV